MSDLAPFVAATIRDKVLLELQKEHEKQLEKLRQELREKIDLIADVAAEAPVITCAAITDRDANKVYAAGIKKGNVYRELFKLNECTLNDLLEAKVHRGSGQPTPIRIMFGCLVKHKNETNPEGGGSFKSLDDIPVSGTGGTWGSFFAVDDENNGIDFELPEVSKERLFEFTGRSLQEYLANPTHLHIVRTTQTLNHFNVQEMIGFFGAETKVAFAKADFKNRATFGKQQNLKFSPRWEAFLETDESGEEWLLLRSDEEFF